MAAAVIVIDRPAMEAPEGFAELPLHQFDLESRRCVFCGEQPGWATYADYVAWFYVEEWEGERYHAPEAQELWEWVNASCMPELYQDTHPMRYREESLEEEAMNAHLAAQSQREGW